MTSLRLLGLICAVAAAPFGYGQEKEKPPQGGPPKPFTAPRPDTFTLKNGAQGTLVPYGSIPKVSVRIVIRVGNVNEGPKQIWLADMTGKMLPEGTATRTAEQIAEQAATMGGTVAVTVGANETSIAGDALSEYAADMVKLLADIAQHPAFPATELNRIRADMLRDLAIRRSTPGELADEAFAKVMYGDHPYGRIFPTEEMLKSYTIEDVRRFYAANAGAARTHVYVAGRFDPEVRKAVAAAFEKWPSGPAQDIDIPKKTAKKSFHLVDRPGAPQSTIRLGVPAPPPTSADYIPLQVTDSLLGGSFGSRITANIREQKGYTYSPRSLIMTHYHDAYWAETADITTAVTGAALEEIVKEINRLRKDPPTAQELEGIKSYLAGLFVIRNSSRQGVISQLRFVSLQGLPADWLRTYVGNVLKVTPQQVQAIAERYLDPDKMALVVVGDKAKVAQQLKQFEN